MNLTEPKIGPEADPLIHWADREMIFPRVAVVARRVLAIPAILVPPERLFYKTSNRCQCDCKVVSSEANNC